MSQQLPCRHPHEIKDPETELEPLSYLMRCFPSVDQGLYWLGSGRGAHGGHGLTPALGLNQGGVEHRLHLSYQSLHMSNLAFPI